MILGYEDNMLKKYCLNKSFILEIKYYINLLCQDKWYCSLEASYKFSQNVYVHTHNYNWSC